MSVVMQGQGVIEAFVAAWNVADEDEADRRRLLEQCWADDGLFIAPGARSANRDELAALMQRVTPRWAGGRARISSVDEHDGWLRYTWKIVRPDGSLVGEGLHVAERAPDGRLQRMIAFYGPLPLVA